MHLLAAQPGGFSDDEGIIDLGQTGGDIVVLSAADSMLAALANTIESLPENFPSIRLANWLQLIKPAAFDLYQASVLDNAQVVVLSLLGGENYWPYGFERLQDWASQSSEDKPRHLVIVPGDDTPDEVLFAASTVSRDGAYRVWRFLREGGAINNQQLFNYVAQQLVLNASSDVAWHEPQVLPRCLMYMPSAGFKNAQASFSEWQQRWQRTNPEGSVCLLLFYRSHLQSANTAMFDQLIDVIEAHGLNPLPIAIASLKDAESLTLVNALLQQSGAALIINTTSFASNVVGTPELSSQPTNMDSPFSTAVPVLQLLLSSSTESDWQEQQQGLRSRDIAMQVVLPEMDGRIVTRAVSFKTQAWYSERCQISVVSYALHRERAEFVVQLAKAYCALSVKDNSEKRIALILANYPTKDGRIGNGVGLDTPASTINILHAMDEAGYSVDAIPDDGTALIVELLGAVTNNPQTLHQLPCWQSLALEEYHDYFKQLPTSSQEAVLSRWGPPDDDPKCRNGRLMLAGIRLGETFVGIQPARGFNMDLLANYHDPDLVPPHSYLAYYFWLRHCYKVDAIIHVGKHGNLEWLPGKGSALSSTCWPDIALGPMPHFYPFIVNDPGEGAQAKRRAQAVIIDHLMPPLTRAETYGELEELEGLVDEYYQALGMDSRREDWLREKILLAVKESNVYQELSLTKDARNDEVLSELDTYLCDIKEAQIRHGLHCLGELPRSEKLADTLLALLRLPRGKSASSQGILHNLVADLGLQHQGEAFDPLAMTAQPWTGERPELLDNLSDSLWRTVADTRERLELLAFKLLSTLLFGNDILDNSEHEGEPDLNASFLSASLVTRERLPQTWMQLDFVRDTLFKALQKSAEQEIQSLITGLEGGFVAPGPSGAPTRGRLDTLPTGRNFFSVDNRSIPSPAAWAIGERSAQSLIERHLQEHGDYPKQLGLSVWGTATMRTGGDDIAQAFALMGIKPVWAQGSHRVVDFEIIPCQLLGRPRIDVTLRVSGFFRDAFANVMRLYDAAVLALAEFDEPGNNNTIQLHIEERREQLLAEGVTKEDAHRQASYRVFGSKPGAYGAGLQGLIDERCWETRADLAEAYLNWGGYAYGREVKEDHTGRVMTGDGVEAKQAFHHRLGQLEAVLHNQDNREHDILDSDDYYQFQGGMANAVSEYSGLAPIVYHSDHSNPSVPKVRTLKEELNRVIRSRVINPKWISAMREHGYKGAFEMAASVDYLFAYDATTNLIDDYQYEQVTDALLLNEQNREFMQEHNPSAMEEMAERLLEATQRGLWQAPGDYADKLQDLLLSMDAQQEGVG